MRRKLLLLAAVAALALAALIHSASPYVTPEQLSKMGSARSVQVIGRMFDLRYDGGVTHFKLTDGRAAVDVVYEGRARYVDSEVVVVGDWDGKVLHAREILRKCHTEYGG